MTTRFIDFEYYPVRATVMTGGISICVLRETSECDVVSGADFR